MKRQIVIATFSLILFLYIIQVMFFSSRPSSSSSSSKVSRLHYRKKLYGHISSRGLMKSFTDIHVSSEEAVGEAVEVELSELHQLGIDVGILDQLRLEKMNKQREAPDNNVGPDDHNGFGEGEVKKPSLKNPGVSEEEDEDEDEKETKEQEETTQPPGNFSRTLSRLFRVRNPELDDLQRLKTPHQVELERVADPLVSSTFCSQEVFLAILVVSQPSDVQRRKYIRESWAHSYEDDHTKLKGKQPFPNGKSYVTSNVVKVVFIMGQAKDTESGEMDAVKEEMRLNKDIVIGSMQEDYRNLTLKTRLALKWAHYECKSAFVLKTDDDVFVNPVVLVEWLKQVPDNNLYTGWCNFNSPVIRNKNSKWYVSEKDFKESTYPGYCLGGGYIMSADVLSSVVKLSYGRPLFPMEDLYVGLVVKELNGVQPRNEKKHFNLVYDGHTQKDCDMNNLFLLHRVLGQHLVEHMKQARNALENC